MGELAAAAETLSKYGAWGIVAVLLLVCRVLWNRGNTTQDARLADAEKHRVELTNLLTKSIENDKDQTHALMALTDVIKGRANV